MNLEYVEDMYELSPLQHGMLFHTLSAPHSGMYIIHVRWDLGGRFAVDTFTRAWQQVSDRHSILRTAFYWEDLGDIGKPLQVVFRHVPVPLTELDWRHYTAKQQQEQLESFLQADRVRGFELTAPPLLRLTLFRLADERYHLLWSFHHLLLDGWSFPLLIKEVFSTYEALCQELLPVNTSVRPYRDYIAWLQQQDQAETEIFWRGLLADIESPTPLGVDRTPHVVTTNEQQSTEHAELNSTLSQATTQRLQAVARQHSLTLNTVLQGAWALLLSRYSRQETVVFGVTSTGRTANLPGIESMIGLFINTLPTKVHVPAQTSLLPWLQEIQVQQAEQRQFEYSSLAQVQSWSGLPHGTSLFESIFVFENYPIDVTLTNTSNGLWAQRIRSMERTNYPLTVVAVPGSQLTLRLNYHCDRFAPETITRMMGHFQTLLEEIAVNPERSLGMFSLLTDDELRQVKIWNATTTAYPRSLCIHTLVEAQVERTPDTIAIVAGDVHLTYTELDRRANQLTYVLRQHGVGPEICVGTYAERSPELIIAFLAILKAGGAYVPLDTTYPLSRIRFLLEDTGIALLLTQRHLLNHLPQEQTKIICVDEELPLIFAHNTLALPPSMTSEQLAYVIYTSGSTGTPKGVGITHQAIARLICETHYVHLTSAEVIAQASTAAFDAATFEIWGALVHGARLVLFDKEVILTPHMLRRQLRQEEVSTLFLTTAIFNQIAQHTPDAFSTLHYLLFGGEAVDVRWVRTILTHGKPKHFLHVYGPTESTTYASWYDIQEIAPNATTIPIGTPLTNTQLYVLDHHGQLAAVGMPGELCIGGDGLARAYLQRPALTAEKFVPHPFSDIEGTHLYRTGDLVRWQPDGNIEFLGRLDQQIKLRGFRIELGEIEQTLLRCPGVQGAIVFLHDQPLEHKRLIAYIVSYEPTLTSQAVRDYLLTYLPEFMIPAFFVFLDALPLTANGKVDRHALPAFQIEEASADHEIAEPRTETEEILLQIWQQVLGLERIDIHDNFFSVGGDSILSIQIVARARQANLSLTPRQVFLAPTIAELALSCASSPSSQIQTKQEPDVGPVPLTPIQCWFFEKNRHYPHHFNQAMLLRPRQALQRAALELAFHFLHLHHDALHLRFSVNTAKQWQQTIVDSKDIPATSVQTIDLSTLSTHEQRVQLERLATQAQASLHLTHGPILRALFIDLGAADTRLLIVIHHLAVDSVSWRILLEDLQQIYTQIVQNQPVQLAQKTTSFRQWSYWLSEYAQSPELIREKDYWTTTVASYKPSPLPIEILAGENTVASTNSITVSLSQEETYSLLHRVAEVYHTQINDLLLTALAQCLMRWLGKNEVLIGLEGHGREDIAAGVDLSRTVGWFTSLYPVHLKIAEHFSLSSTIKSIKEQLRAIPYNGIGYGLLRYLNQNEQVRNSLQVLPHPEVSFNYLGQLDQMQAEHSLFTFAPESVGLSTYPEDERTHLLVINCAISDRQFHCTWSYSLHRHSIGTIQKLATTFIEALRTILAHCQHEDAGGYTPSDFPLALLTQTQIDAALGADRRVEAVYPLSPLQQGLLFHEYYTLHSGNYVVQARYRLYGDLQVEAFKAAWQRVLDRHATLRTSFLWEGWDEPHQVVRRALKFPLTQEDWRNYTLGEQKQRLQSYLTADRSRGFDLRHAPLLRFFLIRTEETTYELIWTMHQIILDGWSLPLVLKEVAICYQSYCQQIVPQLEQVQPFQHYLAWIAKQDHEKAEKFWIRELVDITAPTPLGIDHRVVPGALAIYERQEMQFSLATTQMLQNMAQQQHLTLNTLVQGAWAILLSRYSGQDDVIFGITVSGRPAELEGVETMIGVFINALPLRVRLSPEKSLLTWLHDLQAYLAELRQYEHSSMADIQRWSKVSPNTPLFESMVVFENYPLRATDWNMGADLTIQGVQGIEQTHYPLTLFALPGKRLHLKLFYDSARISSEAATQILDHLQTLLGSFSADPTQFLGTIQLLSAAERRKIENTWNATSQSYPPDSLWQMFCQQVARTPDASAYRYQEQQLTYAALLQQVHYLSHSLLTLGIRPEDRVCVCLPRSLSSAIALLACLAVGGVYVPLDPSAPPPRLRTLLSLTSPRVVLTSSSLAAALAPSAFDSSYLFCMDVPLAPPLLPLSLPAQPPHPEQLAYLLSTSGSTGQPKVIAAPHRQLLNRLHWMWRAFPFASDEVLVHKTALTFVDSLWELLGGLLQDVPTVIIEEPVLGDPAALLHVLAREGVSRLWLVPSLLQLLLETNPDLGERLPHLLEWVSSGEALSGALLAQFTRALPDRQLLNLYGTTEVFDATLAHPKAKAISSEPLSIGTPISNVRVYVLDAQSQLAPVGVTGELVIAGEGLARGYEGQPARTAEQFTPDPWSPTAGGRLYRTGDLVRWEADGQLQYLERADRQVKRRGHRIEMAEMEAVLLEHPAVRQAGVVRWPGDDERLLGYVVLKDAATELQIQSWLREQVPAWLVPDEIVTLDSLPLTSSGKIDRRHLPQPKERARSSHDLVAPRTVTEERVAQIWREVLKHEQVSIYDHFFVLGGHSLLAMQITMRLRNTFQIELPVRSLFEAPTIAEQAEFVTQLILKEIEGLSEDEAQQLR